MQDLRFVDALEMSVLRVKELGPDCWCESVVAFGATQNSAASGTEKVSLAAMPAQCDLDGDLIPQCERRVGPAMCCLGVQPDIAAAVSDCHDVAPLGSCPIGAACVAPSFAAVGLPIHSKRARSMDPPRRVLF